MSLQSSTLGLKARWILPVVSPPLEAGTVVLCNDRIVDVGRDKDADKTVDLGNCAIIPGLVNCHTHLEFSYLQEPLMAPGAAFTDWIWAVLAERIDRASQGAGELDGNGIARGIAELKVAGTAMVGEIATEEAWPQVMRSTRSAPICGVRFWELIGTSGSREHDAREAAQRFLHADPPAGWRSGLSPHAPYTVGMQLLEFAVQLAKRQNQPVAMHLAETREELQLIESQNGPLRELLDALGVWQEGSIPCGARLVNYLERLADAPRSLVVHGNYLDELSTDFLAQRAAKMSVIYCPRTHAYFGHERYPLGRLLRRGVHIALGTDSRASNPDLSLFEEARFIATTHQNVDPAIVLALATLHGARALSASHHVGALRAGMSSDLTIVHLPEGVHDPLGALFHPSSRPESLAHYWARSFADDDS